MAKWIQAAHLEKGSFTAKAKAAGKGVQQYAREKAGAPGKLGKQARLAQTFANKGKARSAEEPAAHERAESPRKERAESRPPSLSPIQRMALQGK